MPTVVKIMDGVSELLDNLLDILRTEKLGKWYEKYGVCLIRKWRWSLQVTSQSRNNDFCRTVNVIVADVRFLTCDGVTFSKKFHVVDCNECIVFITVLTLYRRCVYYTCDLRSTCLCVYIYVVVLVVFSCLQTTSNWINFVYFQLTNGFSFANQCIYSF